VQPVKKQPQVLGLFLPASAFLAIVLRDQFNAGKTESSHLADNEKVKFPPCKIIIFTIR
jgi:hypothetical protein